MFLPPAGDGMVLSFCFSGGEEGKARFKNKYVRTKGFVDEQVRPHWGGGDGGSYGAMWGRKSGARQNRLGETC